MSVKSICANNSKLTPAVGTNNFYGDIFTSHLIIFTNCESVINKNIFTASPIYGICRQCQNLLLSLTDKNDAFSPTRRRLRQCEALSEG